MKPVDLIQLRDKLLKDKQEVESRNNKCFGEYMRGYQNGVLDSFNELMGIDKCKNDQAQMMCK